MAVTAFPFFGGYPVVELVFRRVDGSGSVARRLLVDSGFTGRSAFVLGLSEEGVLRQWIAGEIDVAGALQGRRQRVWVRCGVPALGFRATLTAIVADLASLALPPRIHGIAGLAFLSRFVRWGGDRVATGSWQFFLEADGPSGA